MGLNHTQVVKLFLIIASKLIISGLCCGNIIGLGIGILQTIFHIIPLDPATYYVSYIPIAIQPLTLLWINLLVFGVCLLTLLLPAHYISKRISPIDAIRFD
jgi:lipoprotein-releasing system permease protein